ncbi:hypothetical protein [Streptomyces goshikiensis]|uniref:hypothetical protein n=1 Tax=Streptomyces goshikiensis TaxID=1942 RepID=UPI0037B7FCCE
MAGTDLLGAKILFEFENYATNVVCTPTSCTGTTPAGKYACQPQPVIAVKRHGQLLGGERHLHPLPHPAGNRHQPSVGNGRRRQGPDRRDLDHLRPQGHRREGQHLHGPREGPQGKESNRKRLLRFPVEKALSCFWGGLPHVTYDFSGNHAKNQA